MSRHAEIDRVRPMRRQRPDTELLRWAVVSTAVTAAVMHWFGLPGSTAVAVAALVAGAFTAVWGAAWLAGTTDPPRDDVPPS